MLPAYGDISEIFSIIGILTLSFANYMGFKTFWGCSNLANSQVNSQ